MKTFINHKPKVEVFPDAEALAHKTVRYFVADARKAIETKGVFYAALSGGFTPRRFFQLLGELPDSKSLAWEKIELFWVDERIVSADSQWSNYRLAFDTFLTRVGIPQANIHRIPTEHSDFKLAARCYEQTIREVFRLGEEQIPQFDLMVLGMGADGHTGSLFPNSYASFDTNDLACVVYVMDKKLNRITLTHPVLCAALHLIVLVSGEDKAGILKEVLTSEPDEVRYPIHTLWPVLDKITWLADSKASKLL